MSETPAPDAPARVRLSDPGEVVAAVPALLGFPPRSSLVALSLRGSRAARVGLCMRVDLPCAEDVPLVAAQVADHLVRDGARAAVVLLYAPGDADPGVADAAADAALADTCVRACEDVGVAVRDALRVRDGRWWSYRCAEGACCPPEGRPVPPSAESPVAAAAVAAGRALWPDREDAVAVLAPPGEEEAARMRGVCAEAGEPDDVGGRGPRRVARLLDRVADPRATLTDAQVVDVARLLHDRAVRDDVALWAAGECGEHLVRLLVEVVQRVPAPYDTEAAATLACVAYQRGEGVLARAAVERALLTDPGHRLARLVEATLDAGVPPSALRDAAGPAVSPPGRGGTAGSRP